MLDSDEEIREIKKEIIESRGLVIKTNNLVNSLSADVKSIAKRQAAYEQRFNWSSATAYVLFAALCFGGLYFASDARIREIRSDEDELTRVVKELRSELAEESERAQARTRAETKAAKYYELIRAKKRREVVEGFEAMRKENLSKAEEAFFQDVVDKFRLDLSLEAFQAGLDLVRTGRYAEASEQFERAVRLREDGAHIPAVRYNLARTYRKLDRNAEAMVLAKVVSEQSADLEIQDDATMLLAEAAAELGQIDDARNAIRTLLRKWPRSEFVPDARKKLGELNLRALRGKQTEAAAPAAKPAAAK
ncbi:MAG: tetratricopeptide repeat protein [Myxococcales bacterium]|nr:tetratricopeptide repeat protein [Myxococcales bacterium]